MAEKTITITEENQKDQKNLIGSWTIVKCQNYAGGKILTLSDEPVDEPETEDLNLLTRADLDEMAENLGLDPADYKNKTLLIEAIEGKQ